MFTNGTPIDVKEILLDGVQPAGAYIPQIEHLTHFYFVLQY